MPLRENLLIERIRRRAASDARVRRGIGDDCAVIQLPRDHEAIVTTDFTLEGIHFRRQWHPPEVVGHRCLIRGLSDIAAMGGEPVAAFLSLALPRSLPQRWVNQFFAGLLRLAKQFDVTLAGGDTAESPAGIFADIVVLGSTSRGKQILRSGARPGDGIYVTGELGGSASVIQHLMAGRKRDIAPSDWKRHFYPTPRIEVGRLLRKQRIASAMIDISDGLSTDLGHICEQSRVGACIHADALPLACFGMRSEPVKLETALNGGEDYELLFTARADQRVPTRFARTPIAKIGEIIREPEMRIVMPDGRTRRLLPRGWQHFST